MLFLAHELHAPSNPEFYLIAGFGPKCWPL